MLVTVLEEKQEPKLLDQVRAGGLREHSPP